MNDLIQVITSEDDQIRNRSLDSLCKQAKLSELEGYTKSLDRFWRESDNLYHRVRALFFLSAIYRFYVPRHLDSSHRGVIEYVGYRHLLDRRLTEAIDSFLDGQDKQGPGEGIASGLAHAYRELAFQTLADQVRRSVRTVRGNQWMFRIGHPSDQPLRCRPELLHRDGSSPAFPVLCEKTAVRMDFSHSGWSDIFFLGMDYPDGARVVNASINLGVRGRDPHPKPPIETFIRVIDQPVLKLTSIDLKAHVEIQTIAEVFDFARDYLGLLKAAVIASGIIPPGMEGCNDRIGTALHSIVGPGRGIEIVSKVNDIPKGSRLAVSTNLLGSLISICMRATGQVSALTGPLEEGDRRLIAARAILGEWIGGSGGGWQDSGGVWPGIKLICGAAANDEDPEFGISRGRLLPQHQVFSKNEITRETREKLQNSLVLVHGGMAQNVGPILEMVTEKYLLRSPDEWKGRQQAIDILDEIVGSLKAGDIQDIGKATHKNFFGPLQTIIPWCTNLYTETLVQKSKAKYGDRFWGFWMLGGMAGGGMGFIFDPAVKQNAQAWLQEIMLATKREMESCLPFAMEPVVYDFEINDDGTTAEILLDGKARMPNEYYAITVPDWIRNDSRNLTSLCRHELEQLGTEFRTSDGPERLRPLVEAILPERESQLQTDSLDELLERFGFDPEQHEQIQLDLKSGRYGLSQNRLPPSTAIEDVRPNEIIDARDSTERSAIELGRQAIADGQVAVMTLAAGVGSRWTEGAGVVKGLHPFCRFAGQHRSFIELHLAKSRKTGEDVGAFFPHVITTGYLTHDPIRKFLETRQNYNYPSDVLLSPGKSVGLRLVPMVRDLRFEWEEMAQQVLDEQQQKMRTSLRAALMNWAREAGEGSDYRDNLPLQCLHPVGHWYEIPNMLRNGTLKRLLQTTPQLQYLMLHNIDTVGANVDPGLLGLHIQGDNCLTFEVIERRLDDRGGGLARVNGDLRLLEGLAMPREEDEFRLSYYNSMTTWISVDKLLAVFGLDRNRLSDQEQIDAAVRRMSQRMPTYITIKDVKKRWGHGQEDIFPVTQFEKLWSDMTSLAEVSSGFMVVPIVRGQQLKQQAQLDGWFQDGSADYVDSLCSWK